VKGNDDVVGDEEVESDADDNENDEINGALVSGSKKRSKQHRFQRIKCAVKTLILGTIPDLGSWVKFDTKNCMRNNYCQSVC
jgi:hypothetical protein